MKAKHILIALCLGAVLQATPAMAQLSAPGAPKPPVGVPADAKLFNGKWYKVIFEKTSWTGARDKCRTLGGQLAIIPDEVTWVYVKGLTPANVWLGGTDEKIEGVWVWVDGTPVTFTAWGHNQPDNQGGDAPENYITADRGQWNDTVKNNPYNTGFICEWKDK